MQQRNLYDLLGITQDADAAAIRSAFRKLALKFHPDRNKDPQAADVLKAITKIYETLMDPAKRAQYDASLMPAPEPTIEPGVRIFIHSPFQGYQSMFVNGAQVNNATSTIGGFTSTGFGFF